MEIFSNLVVDSAVDIERYPRDTNFIFREVLVFKFFSKLEFSFRILNLFGFSNCRFQLAVLSKLP